MGGVLLVGINNGRDTHTAAAVALTAGGLMSTNIGLYRALTPNSPWPAVATMVPVPNLARGRHWFVAGAVMSGLGMLVALDCDS